MGEQKLDRRVRRTRRMLREALLTCIIEGGYDDLTITELTERADLRRATFYLHYSDLDELLLAVLRYIFDELADDLQAQRPMPLFYEAVTPPHLQPALEYLAANADLYQALLDSKAGVRVQRFIRDYLLDIKHKQLATVPAEQLTAPPEVLAAYVASSETAMITWWLENDMPYSAATLAAILQDLMLQGIALHTGDEAGV